MISLFPVFKCVEWLMVSTQNSWSKQEILWPHGPSSTYNGCHSQATFWRIHLLYGKPRDSLEWAWSKAASAPKLPFQDNMLVNHCINFPSLPKDTLTSAFAIAHYLTLGLAPAVADWLKKLSDYYLWMPQMAWTISYTLLIGVTFAEKLNSPLISKATVLLHQSFWHDTGVGR